MSEELNPPPVVPSVRFGLRSMVAVTSIAAIFAAAAAPLSWGASEVVQRHLAVAWCATLASVAATYAFYYFRTRRTPQRAGRIRFCGTSAWERHWSPEGPPQLFWSGVAVSPGILYLWLSIAADRANRPHPSLGWTLWIGFFVGYLIARTFRRMITWPMEITDEGVVDYGKLIPWSSFFWAEQFVDRPGVVRFHRVRIRDKAEADPCIQLSPETVSAAVTFVQERIEASLREGQSGPPR